MTHSDQKTAEAFANSWNHLPPGSIYTREQFEDWLAPLGEADVHGRTVLELGCGNGSLLWHMAGWSPAYLEGVELGDSIRSAKMNMSQLEYKNWKLTKADLTDYSSAGFDLVYSIGVIHHLKDPRKGLEAAIRNVRKGGRFHFWVYAREGNFLVIHVVDPLRKIASRLPWWVTKYLVATPLVAPFFLYAKLLALFRNASVLRKLPLYEYSLWIARREFAFFRHVAFDQLVTPQTCYLDRKTIEAWLDECGQIDRDSVYIIMRNGNSWKFGGRLSP